jgi:hypothetical protein
MGKDSWLCVVLGLSDTWPGRHGRRPQGLRAMEYGITRASLRAGLRSAVLHSTLRAILTRNPHGTQHRHR